MDLECFLEFARQAAAGHDAEIAELRNSMKVIQNAIQSLTNRVDRLVDNQVFLQESMDLLTRKMIEESDMRQRDHDRTQPEMQELRRIVFRHVTDPNAHGPTN